MKKFAMGVVVGAVLAFSASTYADDISQLIGKQVDNEYPVVLNGSPLNNRSVAIEGTSYAPVREISEKMGLNVKFENDTVYLTPKTSEAVKVPETTTTPIVTTPEMSKEDKIKALDGQIENVIRTLGTQKYGRDFAKFDLERDPNNQNYKKKIEEYEARIAELEKQKADLEKQKAELQK